MSRSLRAHRILVELRRLVRGVHPPLLTDRGLVAAVEARADLLTLPVVVLDLRSEPSVHRRDGAVLAYLANPG